MNDDLKFQLRLTLSDEFAPVARSNPGAPSISPLTNILKRHDAVMKCQFDAFADYVSEAESNGVENYHLYEWTKKTIEDPAKKAKYVKSFTLYVGGEEVYEKDKADELEAELKSLVGGPIVAKMFRYDTDPAHNPQPPHRGVLDSDVWWHVFLARLPGHVELLRGFQAPGGPQPLSRRHCSLFASGAHDGGSRLASSS